MNELSKIFQILDSDSKEEKIKVLESLSQSNEPEIIRKITSMLSDIEISVRGEAFSSLFINKNDISEFLIHSLDSEDKNERGFSALILANRSDFNAVPALELLTKDPSSMVRSCALGALGHLHSNKSSTVIRNCFSDEVLEVRKSALSAFFKTDGQIFSSEVKKLAEDADNELTFLITKISKKK